MARTLPVDALSWSADALERLAELRAARDQIDWMIERAVIECRTNAKRIAGVEIDTLHDSNRERESYDPISWDRIARQLGVTRQVVWRKYAAIVDEEADARKAERRRSATDSSVRRR